MTRNEDIKGAIKASLALGVLLTGDPEKSVQDAKDALAHADKEWKERYGDSRPWPASRDAVYEAVAEFEQQVQAVRAKQN